jgi:hypothetical protein
MQVDIFSLGIIMYELFAMNLVATRAHNSGAPDEFENYAKRVGNGHREPMRPSWPQSLRVRFSVAAASSTRVCLCMQSCIRSVEESAAQPPSRRDSCQMQSMA